MTYKNILTLMAVLLAVVAPLVTAAISAVNIKNYPVVRVQIEPYDPRDLMYGQYMQYRILWNWDGEQKPPSTVSAMGNCLCLGEGADNPKAAVVSCEPPIEGDKSCTHKLKGNYYGADTFDIGINRYYLDENYALALEKIFQDKKAQFSIGLAIEPSGKAHLENMYIDGNPWLDFIKTLPASVPSDIPAP